MKVSTVGHGTLAQDAFIDLVRSADLQGIADVRSFPGSRRNPQFGREQMERWLPAAGIAYTWMPDLGGRRRPVPDSVHVALRHPAFRAYADYMETEGFLEGVRELTAMLDGGTQWAVMCSESLWWRCHRRLLADHLLLIHDVEVVHLMHDGRRTTHTPTEGVRVEGDHLVYDVGVPIPFPEG